jgi:hypothetical protein
MAFLGFGRRGAQPNKLGSTQIQTSERGVVIPYAGGNVKVPVKFLDIVDFNAQGQSSGGGKGGGGISSYEYYASLDMALCAGPIDGLGNIYDAGGSASLAGTTEYYTVPGGGGTYQTASDTTEADQGATFAEAYSYLADDYGSDGPETISGTQQRPMQRVDSSPGAGQYFVTQNNGFLQYTFAAADAGKLISITYSYTTDTTNYVSPTAKYNLGVLLGGPHGDQWGYMASLHPERAMRYPNIARAVAQNSDLGSDATPPNLGVEVLNARGLSFGGGIGDCDPKALIEDICLDPVVGFGWDFLGDLTQFSNFCVASNLFMAPLYDSQRKGLDVLKEIIMLANSEAVWSGPTLKIVPYGDVTAVANGRTYTPQTTPAYEIDYSDTISAAGEEPIKTGWPGLADNYNSVQFQYKRRDDNYNTDILNAMDEASIFMNGLLPAQTITGDLYCETEYAARALDMLLKRKSVALRTYAFKLKWWYFLLEPMDILLLKPLGDRPVRIVSVEENDDYSLSIIAEDFFYGVGTGVLYPKGIGGGNGPHAHDQPGNTSLLAAFQPNTRVTSGANELWLALGGGSSWGGCVVYLSKDGTTYKEVARQYGAARAGSLTAPCAAGADPDTANSISISTSGSLSSGTQADADVYATLCLIGQELISYETATLTGSTLSANQYTLGTYLRRGIFAGNSSAHGAGEVFVRLDDQITKYTIDPALAGKTVYLKLASFNLYGNEIQDLSGLTAIQISLATAQTASNMSVSSYLETGGSTAKISIFKLGGADGDAGTATLANGAQIVLAALDYTGKACGQWYGINYNPSTTSYVLYTDPSLWAADQATMIPIGSTTTPAVGSGAFYPQNYADTGSSPTSNPSGPYSGGTATVFASATYMPPPPGGPGASGTGDEEDTNGLCTWIQFAGTTAATKTLSVTAACSQVGIGSVYLSLDYSLDGGATWTNMLTSSATLASATYTASIASGTNLSGLQVQSRVYATTPGGSVLRVCSAQMRLSAIGVA